MASHRRHATQWWAIVCLPALAAPAFDINDDGTVDFGDLIPLLSSWGLCP